MGESRQTQDRNDPGHDDAPEAQRQQPTLGELLQSILAAAFGVQTNAARKRDFSMGSPLPCIIGGIVFTVVLIVVLVVVVQAIVRSAGV